jgi:hypothetical protein
MSRQYTYLLALTVFLVFGAHVLGQTNQGAEPIQVNGDSNEDSKAALALLGQTIFPDEVVILIARRSTVESNRKLNRKRLEVVRSYIDVSRATPIPKQNIVMAEGEPFHGRGRIEVYLRGKLFMVFNLGRNKNFAPEP